MCSPSSSPGAKLAWAKGDGKKGVVLSLFCAVVVDPPTLTPMGDDDDDAGDVEEEVGAPIVTRDMLVKGGNDDGPVKPGEERGLMTGPVKLEDKLVVSAPAKGGDKAVLAEALACRDEEDEDDDDC